MFRSRSWHTNTMILTHTHTGDTFIHHHCDVSHYTCWKELTHRINDPHTHTMVGWLLGCSVWLLRMVLYLDKSAKYFLNVESVPWCLLALLTVFLESPAVIFLHLCSDLYTNSCTYCVFTNYNCCHSNCCWVRGESVLKSIFALQRWHRSWI